ncbi:MAG: glycerol-3-phosphate dehydrogenase/oxidase [Acidobacteriota bacterium]
MKRNTAALVDREFDVLILGGGIFGACAAWDATLRGMRVALIERDDFGCGASANSFKMIHGGIRYLQHADFRRLRRSCFERSAMLRIAPHLVHPLPIVIPTYGRLQKGKPFLAAGMLLFDMLTYDRNRAIVDKNQHIPVSRFLSRRRVLDLFPGLDTHGLTGAAMFWDGQMYNPTRLVLAFIQSAVDAGATICNHVEATHLLTQKDVITGVEARDVLTGDSFSVRAKVTLNTAGPWAEQLLNEGGTQTRVEAGSYSRDACFVIPRRFNHPYGLALQGRTHDPGAIVSRQARHLFLVPWRDHTLVGVWHLIWNKGPDAVQVRDSELRSYVEEINWAYPGLHLDPHDITMWNAGLVPFGQNAAGAIDLRYGKESRLVDHQKTSSLKGLVTLIGIRYTMGRGDAALAIDMVSSKLGRHSAPAPTHRIPVLGGQIDNLTDLARTVAREQPFSLDPEVLEAMLHNYGTEYRTLLELISLDNSLKQRLGATCVLHAEVVNAVRNEMAMSLSDIVFRRTDLATGRHPGDATLALCARLAARELGWSDSLMNSQLEHVRSRVPIPGHLRDSYGVPSIDASH